MLRRRVLTTNIFFAFFKIMSSTSIVNIKHAFQKQKPEFLQLHKRGQSIYIIICCTKYILKIIIYF